MDYRVAEFVRFIEAGEALEDLIDEAKAQTWITGREHAALLLDLDQIVLVRGGFDGIELIVDGRIGIAVSVEEVLRPIRRLSWHTHPQPTGPSDHDCLLLERLEQESSIIFEIGGDLCGTVFVQKYGGCDAGKSN